MAHSRRHLVEARARGILRPSMQLAVRLCARASLQHCRSRTADRPSWAIVRRRPVDGLHLSASHRNLAPACVRQSGYRLADLRRVPCSRKRVAVKRLDGVPLAVQATIFGSPNLKVSSAGVAPTLPLPHTHSPACSFPCCRSSPHSRRDAGDCGARDQGALGRCALAGCGHAALARRHGMPHPSARVVGRRWVGSCATLSRRCHSQQEPKAG